MERPKDPKPVLSQTGSPLLPNYDVVYGARSSVKRYRPASTLPLQLPKTNFANPMYQSNTDLHSASTEFNMATSVPFHDKKMVNKIHQSLSHKAAYMPQIPAPVAHPIQNPQQTYNNFNNISSQQFMTRQSFADSEPAWKDTLKTTGAKLYRVGYKQSKTQPIFHSEPQEESTKPKVVNLQYNTPIGLYSRESFNEEFNKQVGYSMLIYKT